MPSLSLQFDLDHQRKRLAFYEAQKQKQLDAGVKRTAILDKWIELYAERVQKLERKISRVGLKTAIVAPAAAPAAAVAPSKKKRSA